MREASYFVASTKIDTTQNKIQTTVFRLYSGPCGCSNGSLTNGIALFHPLCSQQVHTFIGIDACPTKRSTLANTREERSIKADDIITHIETDEILTWTMEQFMNKLKTVRLNERVRMVFER